MKVTYTAAATLIVMLFLLCSSSLFSEERPAILNTVVLEDFDKDPLSRWIARGSKFTTRIYDANNKVVGIYPKVAEVATFPTSLFGFKGAKTANGDDRKVLGIMGKFDRNGYNYIEVLPVREADSNTDPSDVIYEDINTSKKWVHNPIQVPGRVEFFDMWVWGANYDYYLDAHFRDYRGIPHTFKMGDLKYAGWRNLRIVIPKSIPQAEPYIPKIKPLELTKFVLWTRPNERVSGFYLYLDQVKVLTDVYVDRFDGDDLADVDLTEKVWGSNSE